MNGLLNRAKSKNRRSLVAHKSRLAFEQLEGRAVPASGLGIANDFSAFVLHDANLNYSAINGRAAVGGNANFSSYTIGDALPNSYATRDDLIVGGNLNYMYGQVFNGNVVYGGTGTFTSFGHPNGTIRHDSVINFASAETQLDTLSDQYAALPTNGTTQDSMGTVTLTGTNADTNVFRVTNGQLWNAKNLVIKAPAGSSVIVNMVGTTARMQFMGMSVQGTTADHVLLNFYQATNLTLNGVGIQGSVLAPRATLTFSNGDIFGNLVAGTWTGYGHVAYMPPEITPPTPATSTISGLVYVDQNRDGVAQSSEPRLSGVAVFLFGMDSGGHPVYRPTTTDGSGNYSFANLDAGTYSIVVPPPTGYLAWMSSIGAFGGTGPWNLVTGISVPSGGGSAGGYNFGMVPAV